MKSAMILLCGALVFTVAKAQDSRRRLTAANT